MRDQATIYGELCAPFDNVFTDNRGGVELSYITGEQCVTRLNEVLGVGNWSFVVREHGVNQESDEVWVLGALTAIIPVTVSEGEATRVVERTVVREQFGSQKIKRSRATNAPLDIGFDLKGAATDALKKCAQSLGVGLYLARKEFPRDRENGSGETGAYRGGYTRYGGGYRRGQ